jgi:hypothetical protein
MSRTVHVIQGLSAAGSLKQAIHPQPGELLVNEDVLSCGPLAPFRCIDDWTRIREAYWESVAPGYAEESFNSDLLANAHRLRDVDTVVLWLGIGAAEQILLAWIAQLLTLIESEARIHVIQFSRVGSRHLNAWALGLLTPDQLRGHPPAEQVSPQGLIELERLWERVTSSDPAGLVSALSDETVHLQYSRTGLQPLIHRYPDYVTGLGRWDSELLRTTRERGPSAAQIIGHTMGNNFDADLVGDLYLFSRLRRLADSSQSNPLVSISGDPGSMRGCNVVLTDAGESVLAGRANAIELNGIDEWILGVHLDSKGVWYLKDGVIVRR